MALFRRARRSCGLGSSFRNNKELQKFVLNDVTPTGKSLGTGSYGSVEEVIYQHLPCAGKKLHEALLDAQNEGVPEMVQKYLEECQLMSSLRHPNITQFLGICFFPGTQLPLLVMEQLETSLDDLLEHMPHLPISLKCSVLEDVASGLLYLHKRNPPVIHRDLTAKNVLLTSHVAAKITDMGNSRIIDMEPGRLAQTLSKLPGTLVYMPPEALDDRHSYGPPLDVFSFGHLALFTVLQIFPGDLLPSTYPDPDNPSEVRGRTELERRVKYIDVMEAEFGRLCPALVQLVKQCLLNIPDKRPSTEELLTRLQRMRSEMEGAQGGSPMNLDIMVRVRMANEMKMKDRQIEELTEQVHLQLGQLEVKDGELEEKGRELAEKGRALADATTELERLTKQMDADKRVLEEKGREAEEKRREADEKGRELEEMRRELDMKGREAEEKGRELEGNKKKLENVMQELEVYRRELDTKTRELEQKRKIVQPPEIPVEEQDWYYGDIDRKLAERKCKMSGDYIVRHSPTRNLYVLTCNWEGHGRHFMFHQQTNNGSKSFKFESESFPTIRALLEFYVKTATPITKVSGAIILKAVPKHDKWSLARADVQIKKKVWKGTFGDVFKAVLREETVLVKTCQSSEFTDVDKFLWEADILKKFNHPNVIRLLGECANEVPLYIVMEFVPGGTLLDYLRKKGERQTEKKLCAMCIDPCRGLEYLAAQHCIHCDIAARNCVVGDDDVIKISSFGMSKEEEQDGVCVVPAGILLIPIKWTAPEALNYGKYSFASDVWSFGILLWEVYSNGSTPYPGMSNHDARSQIECGYRMPPPTGTPESIYEIMQQCWQYDPKERSDSSALLKMLTDAHSKMKT